MVIKMRKTNYTTTDLILKEKYSNKLQIRNELISDVNKFEYAYEFSKLTINIINWNNDRNNGVQSNELEKAMKLSCENKICYGLAKHELMMFEDNLINEIVLQEKVTYRRVLNALKKVSRNRYRV